MEDLTLADMVRVGMRYGIRFNFRVVPRWNGPWRLDREEGEWFRSFGDDGRSVIRRLDAR